MNEYKIITIQRFLFVFSAILMLSVFAFTQEKQRVIEWTSVEGAPTGLESRGTGIPYTSSDIKGLELIEIKVAGKPITIGESFVADDDWLKSLSVKVKNTSGKQISSIRISFSLPEAKYKEGTLGFSFTYGHQLATNLGKDFSAEEKTIMPDETIELKQDEKSYNNLLNFMKKRSELTNFKAIKITNAQVVFVDGLNWMTFKMPIAK